MRSLNCRVCMTVVWLLVVPPVSAADPTTEFRSRLGFTLTLPPNWWPLAADIVSEKSEGAEEHRELAELDPETLRALSARPERAATIACTIGGLAPKWRWTSRCTARAASTASR